MGGVAFLIGVTDILAPVSYMIAALNFPLIDGELARIDGALGWHNIIGDTVVLRIAYKSLAWQAVFAVCLLSLPGRSPRVFLGAFTVAAVACIAISAVLPAVGTSDAMPWSPIFAGLRDGTVRTLVAGGAQGIVSFPSFHAALAVILIATLWSTAGRWLAVVLNGLCLMATPTYGAHYLVDVIAGVVLGILSVAVLAAAWRSDRTQATCAPSLLASLHRVP